MLTKNVTYEDFNGNSVTETLHFSLSKLEMVEMELREEGGLEATVAELKKTQDARKAFELFKNFLLDCYGVRSEDGKRFIKTPEIREDFKYSPALSEIVIEFIKAPETAGLFIEACMPKHLVQQAKADAAEARKQAENNTQAPELTPADPVVESTIADAEAPSQPDTIFEKKSFDQYSRDELLALSEDEYFEVVGTSDPLKMTQEQLIIAMQRKNQKQQ